MTVRIRGIACLLASCALSIQMLGAQKPGVGAAHAKAPFSYPSAPTDEMALMNAPLGTELTPSGYLYTGYGELMFLIGNPARPAHQRIRTLEGGDLPIFQYSYFDGSVRYEVTTFTGSRTAGDKVSTDYIRVVATNTGQAPRASYFSVALRYSGKVDMTNGVGTHRFARPFTPSHAGGYSQPGVHFDPQWTYGFKDGLALRSGQVMYVFPTSPKPALWLTRLALYSRAQKLDVLPDTPVLLAQYQLHLQPGASQTLDFTMPVVPVGAQDATGVAELRQARFDAALTRTRAYWQGMLAKGIQIELPEKKVTDTFKANLIDDLMARDHVGNDYIQTVNKLQYHAFWLRDGSNIAHAYDVTGYPEVARQDLLFFLKTQRADGLFLSQPGQYDGWGQAVWALGKYYDYTHDRGFAEQVYPAIQRAVAWLKQARANDPLHLLPASNPHDDEFTRTVAHTTGFNFWALDGLREAVGMAKALGHADDAADWQREYADYSATLLRILKQVTAKTDGYIPPGLDVAGGQDWGNMDAVYPEPILAPNDPDVTATLARTRAKFAEGLMTYGGRLHHYITMKDTETEVVRGDQREALGDLYAILVHTSSTGAGFEWGVRPWADRDFGQDLAPHGWFSAEYMILLRNMLVREQGDQLHLLSVVSPAWAQAGDHIRVRQAPTLFGPVGFDAAYRADGMTLTMQSKFTSAPAGLVVHLPWFVKGVSAKADGRAVTTRNGQIELPAGTRRLEVSWRRVASGAGENFAAAVAAWRHEYALHQARFRREGAPAPAPIPLD